MAPNARENELRRRLAARFEKLSPSQRRVASYLLEHVSEAPFLSVPELARRTGVSDATVVRCAQRIGYPGFSELKADLIDAVKATVAGSSVLGQIDAVLAESPGDDLLTAVARQEVANVERSVREMDRGAFRAASEALFGAEHVYGFGLGISSHFAGLLTYLLTQIGVRSTRLSTGFSSPLEQTVLLRPTDLLVVFSFPPYSRQTVELLGAGLDGGATTLAICDSLTAPAATLSPLALAVRSKNMIFTNSFAAVSVLLNALITDAAHEHRDRAIDAVSTISRILDEEAGRRGEGR
jgi:DNA-binding MurR/RpiR family transcriptional regulator